MALWRALVQTHVVGGISQPPPGDGAVAGVPRSATATRGSLGMFFRHGLTLCLSASLWCRCSVAGHDGSNPKRGAEHVRTERRPGSFRGNDPQVLGGGVSVAETERYRQHRERV